MSLTIHTSWFELCIRTKRMYIPSHDEVMDKQFAVRFGKRVWSSGKGWRKIGAAA